MIKIGKREKYDKSDISDLLLLIIQDISAEVQYEEDFWAAYSKRIGFNNKEESKRFQACIDLISPTESAIINSFKYQLGDLSRKDDLGEKHLRLYGILNAVYQQYSAIRGIADLLKYPERDKIYSQIQGLEIYDLRKVAGAHTVNYDLYDAVNNKSRKVGQISFRIVEFYLDKTGKDIRALDERGNWKRFNLLTGLNQYQDISISFLKSIVLFAIEKIVVNVATQERIKGDLKFYNENFIDYSILDKNRRYKEKLLKRGNRLIKSTSVFLESLDKE